MTSLTLIQSRTYVFKDISDAVSKRILYVPSELLSDDVTDAVS